MTKSPAADCQETGIISEPNTGNLVWDCFTCFRFRLGNYDLRYCLEIKSYDKVSRLCKVQTLTVALTNGRMYRQLKSFTKLSSDHFCRTRIDGVNCEVD